MFQQSQKQVKVDNLVLEKKVVLVTVKVRNLFAMMDLLVNPKKYVDAKVILWALILEKV